MCGPLAFAVDLLVSRVAVIVQIYVSINRPDLAKKQFERSKRWAEDDLLLQLIESTIGLATGRDGYSNSSSFYTEQLANPSLSSPHILTSRGVTRILRNEIQEAKSDLEESLEQQKDDPETLAAYVVAAGLGALKKSETEDLWRYLPKTPFLLICIDLTPDTVNFPANIPTIRWFRMSPRRPIFLIRPLPSLLSRPWPTPQRSWCSAGVHNQTRIDH